MIESAAHALLVWLGLWTAVSFQCVSTDKKLAPKPDSMSYEDVLVKYVLDAYKSRSKFGRPVLKFNDTQRVDFAIQLTQIVDLDEQEQVLTLNVWDQYRGSRNVREDLNVGNVFVYQKEEFTADIRKYWKDDHIGWDPEEYGNVSSVRIPSDKLWTPDIKLYNHADLRLDEHREALCIVNHTGFIYWMPQAIYRSSCPIDVYAFPFDVQNCTLRFASWTYDGGKLDLHFYDNKDYIDLTEYTKSNAWKIIDVPAFRNVIKYTSWPYPYIDLKYYLVFQRRATLYNYILILPCILLTSITLILFWIPPESPAKMQLGLTIFIAFFILLKLLEKNLPPGTSRMPLLGTYYCLNMIIITMSCFLNVLIVDLTAHGTRANKPPSCIRLFYNVLAKYLRMEDLVRPLKASMNSHPAKQMDKRYEDSDKWTSPLDSSASTEALAQLHHEHLAKTGGPLAEIDQKLFELRSFIREQRNRLDEKDRKELMAKHWKAVALICDRIFFVVYLVIIIASLSYTLPVLTSTVADRNMTMLAKAGLRD